MKDLVIFGSGGFAREVLQVARDINEAKKVWNVLGFLDEDVTKHSSVLVDLPVLGGPHWLADKPDIQYVLGVGSPAVKHKIVEVLSAQTNRAATLIHPLAWIGDRVRVGEGTVICAGCMITCDVSIARYVTLNLACTVGHDSNIKDFATAAPTVNISGNVSIGEGAELGTGGCIIQGIEVGSWSIVGAGGVVVQSLPPNVTAVGSPARVVKERNNEWHISK